MIERTGGMTEVAALCLRFKVVGISVAAVEVEWGALTCNDIKIIACLGNEAVGAG